MRIAAVAAIFCLPSQPSAYHFQLLARVKTIVLFHSADTYNFRIPSRNQAMSSPPLDLFITSFGETLLMTGVSGFLGSIIGALLGLFLHLTQRHVIAPTAVTRALGLAINGLRSTPSIIILAATIPLAHVLLGNPSALLTTLVPLSIHSTPFVTRSL